MKAHVIENGVVVNTIVVSSLADLIGVQLVDGSTGGIGWLWDGAKLHSPDGSDPGSDPGPVQAPDIDALAAQYEIAVQRHLDTTAQAFGYDNMATAVTYADEPAVARFQAEGSALRAWRSLVWEACYMMLAEVRAGTRAVPTEAEVIAALPEAPAQEALA